MCSFITNTGKAVYTHNTFKAGLTDFHDRAPLETMAPQQLRKYRTVSVTRAAMKALIIKIRRLMDLC
jgi:hypothetical protein